VVSEQFLREIKLKRDKIDSYEKYPFSLKIVQKLKCLKLHKSVTFIAGENGTGKSTLLEAIAIASGYNPEGGTKNFNFATRASHSILHEYIQLVRGTKKPRGGFFLRAESFYNVATEIEHLDAGPGGPPVIGSYGSRSLHEQSHGESIISLFMNRFGGNSLYFLDEPETALSPRRQMALVARIHQLVKMNSQFIIATHSPIIMSYPDAYIYALVNSSLKKIKFEETEHYQDMKDFMNKYKEMLEILMSEE
jgi:predicted ATPase